MYIFILKFIPSINTALRRKYFYSVLLFVFICLKSVELEAGNEDIKLPLLGDSSSGIVSKQQEYQLGRAWLKAFRSRVKEFNDPLMQDYFENLIYNLATYSELENPRLELIIVNNPTMNAFAVPGGIIGVHTGIFSYAENEDQMVSVLAHELAHLSQRHFARGLEAQRNSATAGLAGLLAGLVLAATVGGDAGLAALSASQALTTQNQLRYSRSNEKEADRFGLRIMEASGRDPRAAAAMFSSMMKRLRYAGSRPPEFLLTHPITEKRIADAKSRTLGNTMRYFPDNSDYYLMQARASVATAKQINDSVATFQGKLDQNVLQKDAALYGLVLSYIKLKQFQQAEDILTMLLQKNPRHPVYNYTAIELEIARKNYKTALNKVSQLMMRNPNSYPLLSLRAEALWLDHQYEKASQDLTVLARKREQDPTVWYRLAEVRGLAGDISGVHQARAEYFMLVGAFSLAREQLVLALKLVNHDFKRSAIFRQRLRDIVKMEERAEKL